MGCWLWKFGHVISAVNRGLSFADEDGRAVARVGAAALTVLIAAIDNNVNEAPRGIDRARDTRLGTIVAEVSINVEPNQLLLLPFRVLRLTAHGIIGLGIRLSLQALFCLVGFVRASLSSSAAVVSDSVNALWQAPLNARLAAVLPVPGTANPPPPAVVACYGCQRGCWC